MTRLAHQDAIEGPIAPRTEPWKGPAGDAAERLLRGQQQPTPGRERSSGFRQDPNASRRLSF